MSPNQTTINKRESNMPASKYRITKKYFTPITKKKPKRSSTPVDTICGDCFKTTGIIIGEELCLEVSHMLIDSGASSSFISLSAAHAARLPITDTKPVTCLTHSGIVQHDRQTTFTLYLAGVQATIEAYIDDGPRQNDHHILLGIPAIEQYRLDFHGGFGPSKETAVSVKPEITGQHRLHFYPRRDPYHGRSTMRIHGLRDGVEMAKRSGETKEQQGNRVKCELLEKKLQKAKDRYKKSRSRLSRVDILGQRAGSGRYERSQRAEMVIGMCYIRGEVGATQARNLQNEPRSPRQSCRATTSCI